MLARFLGKNAANSRPGSPITGGNLVTGLPHSYGSLSPNFIRNLTRFKDNDLLVQFLSVMRVVVNTGGGFVIPLEDVEQPTGQQEEQPRQSGWRNFRSCGERGQPQQTPQQFEGRIPIDLLQSRVGTYFDNLCGGVNYHNQAIDVLFTQLNVGQPPTMTPHYPYIPTWEEL